MRKFIALLAACLTFALVASSVPVQAAPGQRPQPPTSTQAAAKFRAGDYGRFAAAGRSVFDKTFKHPGVAKKIVTDKVEAALIRKQSRMAQRTGKPMLARATIREMARAKVERMDQAPACAYAGRDYYLNNPAVPPCDTPFDGRLTDDEARNIDTLFCSGEILLGIAGAIWGPGLSKVGAVSVGFAGAKCFWDNNKPPY